MSMQHLKLILGRMLAHSKAMEGLKRSGLFAARLLAASLVFSGAVAAQESGARLGAPEVLSSLGSPLVVRVPILNAGEINSASRFSIGVPSEQNGVPFIDSAQMGLERIGGKTYLLLKSRALNHEPAIGFVVREQLDGGIRSREFVVLVDPPGLALTQTALPEVISPTIASDSLTFIAQPPKLERDDAVPAETPTEAVAAEVAPSPARSRVRRTRAPAVAAVAADAAPRAERRLAPKRARAADPTLLRKNKNDGVLKLSLSTGELASRAALTDQERADIRDRAVLLDVDDKTSELLDQRFKITRLERQLADIQARIADAEKRLEARGVAPIAAGAPSVAEGATPAAAAIAVLKAPTQPIGKPAQPVGSAAPAAAGMAMPNFSAWWDGALAWTKANLGLLLGIVGGLLALALSWFGYRRYQADAAARSVLYVPDTHAAKASANTADAAGATAVPAPASGDWAAATWRIKSPGSESPAQAPSLGAAPSLDAQTKPHAQGAAETTPKTAAQATTNAIPSSFWDDDGIGGEGKADEADSGDTLFFDESDVERAPDFPLSAVATPAAKPGERSRELYLRHRYPEIAMLNPALDDEKALIQRAVTLYDEGATDFAKRLLKYAAYQRPINDRYWLALLELLFRENLGHEFAVNAKWFHHHLPLAKEWTEVQRIGFILSPHESIFADAATASHERPPAGRWFPLGGLPAISLDLPSLKLELAS